MTVTSLIRYNVHLTIIAYRMFSIALDWFSNIRFNSNCFESDLRSTIIFQRISKFRSFSIPQISKFHSSSLNNFFPWQLSVYVYYCPFSWILYYHWNTSNDTINDVTYFCEKQYHTTNQWQQWTQLFHTAVSNTSDHRNDTPRNDWVVCQVYLTEEITPGKCFRACVGFTLLRLLLTRFVSFAHDLLPFSDSAVLSHSYSILCITCFILLRSFPRCSRYTSPL